ncbi:MAG: rod shape-determining protein MreD [Burkholderiaceae bacterium]|nr:rod shape-determining protein MreD [Burkholderiaceae bacterium]
MKRTMLGRTPTTAMITGSFVAAFVLELLPWGNLPVPNFLALMLVFWNVFQPRRVGIALAWLLGIVMDVHSGALLGQHALAYSILSYGAIALHRRLLWYSLAGQALQLLPLFFLAHVVVALVHLFFSGIGPSWVFFLSPLLTALLWVPLTSGILRRLNRPISSTAAIGR